MIRSENKRARNVYERLLTKHPEIIIVSKNPIKTSEYLIKLRFNLTNVTNVTVIGEPTSNEKVTNLSVENAKSVGENIAVEREKVKINYKVS